MVEIRCRQRTLLRLFRIKSVPFISYGNEQRTTLSRPATNVNSLSWILPVAMNDSVPYGLSERQLHVLFFAGNTF
jgi:hypothetical protein